MNKFYLYILSLLFSWTFSAQNLHVDSNNYASIDSYNGIIKPNAYRVWLDGNGSLNLPTWRISVRVIQPITNGSQIFPADKLSLMATPTYGQFNQGTAPTISQIGMPLQAILQQNQEVFLVPQSQAGLYNTSEGNQYYNLYMPFDLKVEGGSYLSAFTTWSEFQVPLEFKFYDSNNNIKGVINAVYRLQIATLSGTPPDPKPQLSITIEGNAVNGLLELKTKKDYIQGASVVYPNALKVNANTDYHVKVKSLQGTFMSGQGNTLPLNTIQVSLTLSSGNSAAVFPIWLGANSQKIASGGSTQGTIAYYNIKYASKPNDPNFIISEKDNYYTTLQYEITPQ